jgi:D-amino peptidase
MHAGRSLCLVVIAAVGGAGVLPQRATSPSGGWRTVEAAPSSPDRRVLVIYDMEGLAGVDRFEQTNCLADAAAYANGREQLVADVNAVVDGLIAGGAADVRVYDQHGSGCDKTPDLPADKLDARAKPHESKDGDAFSLSWDAIALVGMHARGGSGGFLAHTGTYGGERHLNDRAISEPDIYALPFGGRGIPIIFISGDDYLGKEMVERFPWITYVTVKRTISPDKAEPRPVDEARRELREGAREAMRKRGQAKGVQLVPPLTAGFRAIAPLTFEPLRGVPGFDVRDGLVTFTAASFGAAFQGINALDRVATQFAERSILDEMRSSRKDVAMLYDTLFRTRWAAGEAGIQKSTK